MFYVDLVSQYSISPQFDDEMVQIVMNEALKYEGFPYVFGGDNPNTSFDCSGLTQWSYRKAGINLPRTAQQQYNVTEHIPLSEAKPGDLVFFILRITRERMSRTLGSMLETTKCITQVIRLVMRI